MKMLLLLSVLALTVNAGTGKHIIQSTVYDVL